MSNVCSKPECCGPTTSEYETLKAENELLKSQINRIVNDVEAGSSEEVRINKILHPECFEDGDDDEIEEELNEIEKLKQEVLDLQNMLGESYSKHDVADMENEIDNMLGEIKELKDKKEELDNCFQELCDDIIKSGATWGACSHPSDLVASWVHETIDEIEELKRKAEELEMEVSMCVQDKEEDIAKLEKYVRAWNIIGSNHWDWFSESIDKTTAHRFIDLGVAQKDDFCWDLWSDDE